MDKIRDILGKGSVLLRTGDLDGIPCFLIGLPAEIWEKDGKQVFPKVLIEQDPAPLAIPEPDSAPVGNLEDDPAALAISEEAAGDALAISQKEDE